MQEAIRVHWSWQWINYNSVNDVSRSSRLPELLAEEEGDVCAQSAATAERRSSGVANQAATAAISASLIRSATVVMMWA